MGGDQCILALIGTSHVYCVYIGIRVSLANTTDLENIKSMRRYLKVCFYSGNIKTI